MTKKSDVVYEFGAFRLDVTAGVLFYRTQRVQLTRKEIETLCVLVENAGRLVQKDHLIERVWGDVCVEPGNLTQNIFILRKALALREPNLQFIETVSKRGYRFLAEVAEISTIAAVGPKSLDKVTTFDSLAVLPFINETRSGDADYLSDGLTESIINSLCQLRDIRVLASASVFRFKSVHLNVLQAGRELGVSLVLIGRLAQLDDTLVVKSQLIDVRTGFQIWGEQFQHPMSGILTLQENIAESISSRLKARLTGEEERKLKKRYTEDVNAYHLYLKGRYHWERFNPAASVKAIDYFQRAIKTDPTYALAYAGLADAYYRSANVYAPDRQAMPKAKAAALKALEIDENLPEAHAALGLISLAHEWDWSGARKGFARAIEINPGYAVAYQRAALLCNLLGNYNEALRELQHSLDLNPLSPNVYWGFALNYFLRRDYKSALEEITKSVELETNYVPSLHLLGRVYEQLQQFSAAIDVFQTAISVTSVPILLAALGRTHALAGDRERAGEVIADLTRQAKKRYVSSYHLATIHVSLDNRDLAIDCLERAYQAKCEMICWLKVDPAFDPIRGDSRFEEILQRLGLSEGKSLQRATSQRETA